MHSIIGDFKDNEKFENFDFLANHTISHKGIAQNILDYTFQYYKQKLDHHFGSFKERP